MEINEKLFVSTILGLSAFERGTYIQQVALDLFAGKVNEPWMVKPKVQRRKKPNEAYSEQFLSFWAAYPSCANKSGKGAAWKEWCKVPYLNTDLLKFDCLKALEWQKHTDKWTTDDGKYICKPENYLKDRMFEDEPIAIKKTETYMDMNGQIKERSL